VGFTTRFDKSSNKDFERHLHAENRSHLYQPASGNTGIDSVNRLLQYQRGTLSSSGDGAGSVTTPITLPNTDTARTYNLDHLGNWKTSVFTPVGGSSTTDLRQTNELNQIVTRKVGGGANIAFVYDKSGNLLDDGVRVIAYDAFNRMVQIKRKSDDEVIGEYVYDANPARRIRKTVTNEGITEDVPNGTTDFVYAPGTWQVTEERDDEDAPTKQYLWGTYIDELIQQKTYVETGPQDLVAGDYYPMQDLLYRNTAMTDDSGAIVEVYDTDAYGNTLLITAAGTGGNFFADDATQSSYSACGIIFCGYQWDAESGLAQVRWRDYNPQYGWLQRDPIDFVSRGYYEYCFSQPTGAIDPTGERPSPGRPIVSIDPLGAEGGGGGGGIAIGSGPGKDIIDIFFPPSPRLGPTPNPTPIPGANSGPVSTPSGGVIFPGSGGSKGGGRQNWRNPKEPGRGPCEFYLAWCWDFKRCRDGYRAPASYQDANCPQCYEDCKRTGRWSFSACPMGAPRGSNLQSGPRWPSPDDYWDPVWPNPPGVQPEPW
jgi:RHS repeat-associated protein